MVPFVARMDRAPLARLGSSRYAKRGGGFVLGLSLGFVFIPCAGPILAAISTAGANHRFNASSILLTLFYSAGAALPLLVFAVLAQRAVSGWQTLRAHLPIVRRVAGAVLAVTTLALAFNWSSNRCSGTCPGYTSALEDHLESSGSLAKKLEALDGEKPNQFAKKAATMAKMATLPDLGPGPGLRRHCELVQHAGRQAADLGPAEGQGGAGRLLDLLVHQLPALPPARRGLVSGLQERRLRRGGGEHTGVRVRACHLQRPQRGEQPRYSLPRGHRQQLRDMGRL